MSAACGLNGLRRAGRRPCGREHVTAAGGKLSRESGQIREYRPGDARRFIHWNQSARTGSLWIKEYETQEEPGAELLVDTSAGQPLDAAAWDAFYELFFAVVLGLLQCSAAVQVYWYDPGSSAFRCDTVYAATQCREVLFHLYQAEPARRTKQSCSPLQEWSRIICA